MKTAARSDAAVRDTHRFHEQQPCWRPGTESASPVTRLLICSPVLFSQPWGIASSSVLLFTNSLIDGYLGVLLRLS